MSMTTLDEKLEKILLDSITTPSTPRVVTQPLMKAHFTWAKKTVAAIHAAFKESGYARVAKHPYRDEQHTINYPDGSRESGRVPTFTTSHYQDAYLTTIKKEMGWMTGQEFYDRFEAELEANSMASGRFTALELAARAAGVTHE